MVRILIIDDDADLRLLTRRMLGMLGSEVIEARNGVEGQKLALEANPEMILLDIMMPVQDGLTTCANLRELGFTAPIVLISAIPEATGREQAEGVGATDYIQKPVTRTVLKRHLDALQGIS